MVSFLAVGLKETSKIEMFCKVISIFQRNPPWWASRIGGATEGDADSVG
jgi:hypothetical protein